MMSQIANELKEITQTHGEFSFNIPLPQGVWTKGYFGNPHTRLRRILQTTSDVMNKPLSDCRILDLGCLDGLFSLEFASHSCPVLGLDVREPNIARARFCARAMNLKNIEFVEADARNISVEKYGKFDAIICCGLLYHLTASDAITLIQRMYEMAERAIIVDTNISLAGIERFNGHAGHTYFEHRPEASKEEKLLALWASADNETSFWFTRPSLINILTEAGFSSVYECFSPAHMNFGESGLEAATRCTFVAIKAPNVTVHTSPAVNELKQHWPEGSLSYSSEKDPTVETHASPAVTELTEQNPEGTLSNSSEKDPKDEVHSSSPVNERKEQVSEGKLGYSYNSSYRQRRSNEEMGFQDGQVGQLQQEAEALRSGETALDLEVCRLRAEIDALERQNATSENALSILRNSITWKLLSPLWRLETRGHRKAKRHRAPSSGSNL
jgi:hypothetical protein